MLEIEDSIYKEIKSILEQTRNKVYKVANSTMVEAYWSIGRVIVEKQGGNNKAEYGVYIDSIASRLIEVQKIKPRMIYSENVYWIVHSNNKIVLHGINYSEV